MAFIIDPATLNASAREWTVHGKRDDIGPIYVVHMNVDDLRTALPDLPHDRPDQVLAFRRTAWEVACEKAIGEDRPMPIYKDEDAASDRDLSHMRIVLQPDEL